MNFRNRKLVLTVRTIFGLFLLLSGLGGLLQGSSTQGVPTEMIPIMQVLWSTGLLTLIKTTEFVSGLMFLFGFFPALAAIFIAPVGVGIVIFNSLTMPAFAIFGVIVCLFDAYFGYAYWDQYRALFARKKDLHRQTNSARK